MEVGGDNKSWCAILGISDTKAWEGGGKGDGRRENFISKDQNKRWSRLRHIVSSRGGKRGRRFPRRPARSGARELCGGRDVRGCRGREGARAGAARPAQLCAPASLGSKLLAPEETRCLCGARGGTPAGTPRASSPSSSIPRREGAGPGRGGSAVPSAAPGTLPRRPWCRSEQGARRRAGRCQKGPQHCRPPAQLGPRRSLPSAALPVPPTPPVRGFSRPPGGVPTPRSPPLSPLPPQGNPSFLPPLPGGPLLSWSHLRGSRHPNFASRPQCQAPFPFPVLGVPPAPPRLVPGLPHPGLAAPALRRAEEPSGIGTDRRRGRGCWCYATADPPLLWPWRSLFRGFSEVGRGSAPSSGEEQLEAERAELPLPRRYRAPESRTARSSAARRGVGLPAPPGFSADKQTCRLQGDENTCPLHQNWSVIAWALNP